jgi:hypothetical protein
VNAESGHCGSALHAAASEGHDRIVQLLLEKDANVNADDSYRYGSALRDAAFCGHESIVQLLLQHGADVNARCEKYGTALNTASAGHKRIVALENGMASVDDCWFRYERVPTVSPEGNKAIISILLENGAVYTEEYRCACMTRELILIE